jgi:hypothetical protein
MAMRRMILNGDLTEYQLLASNSRLHQFFWGAAQDLKYQVLRALKTDRRVDVYGDIGWENVCPQYYRGSLDNGQIGELFARDDTMILLANCSYTYLDASGPVYDMIRRGVHWVNLPVVAKTEPLKGIAAIEYETPEQLNDLVNDIKPGFKKAETSLGFYRHLLKTNVEDLVDGIIGEREKVRLFSWREQLGLHDNQINAVLDEYTDTHEVMMRSFQRMFKV